MSSTMTSPAPAKGASQESAASAARRSRTGTKRRVGNVGWGLVALVVFVFSVFPFYWMLNTSLQPARNTMGSSPSFFPTEFTLRAFDTAINEPNPAVFSTALQNSLIVTFMTLVACLVVGFMAALAVARFTFKGRRTFIISILVVQMLPAEAMFVSLYRILDSWQLTNTFFGLALAYVGGVLPFTIWTLRGFVAGVPADLEEAAMIDGCSRGKAFWKVTFPLLAPGLVSTGIFAFLQAWNEFVLALVVMTRPENVTLPVWLRYFQQATRGTDWSALMAGSVLMSIPVLIFFLIVQGRMTGGLVSGAVKG
ncbi:carbohydrate ABC transporter membrane protein 2 (CUT1 family) [Sediminihabitans luteus]|uniref:Carbohydrate ABC transporter membrane protein 2 (CUT1 family) n=1 Tax=Sediminihabitans luteus TaxID=1138585 RepID=A0A2M9CYD3_9CELL|nr:carbohydrate ABC transporter permease [Sediminihabitans luteus]PJJ76910.1 carbohydrate ABC transporter membrane protein 2 (CUT1 family) [Sediminihabitans luteus]GII99551.1 sugar ABC transporter permease [Sediminihabitans luteus]